MALKGILITASAMARWYSPCLFIALLPFKFWYRCEGTIQIIEHPHNTTVLEGESVLFHCGYTGTDDLPYWKIGLSEYSPADIPVQYTVTAEGLSIVSVEASMNNTRYLCFFTVYAGGGNFVDIESSPAYLRVRRYVQSAFTTNSVQRPSSEVSLTFTHTEILSSRLKSVIYSGYTTYTSIYQTTQTRYSGHNTYTSTYQIMADSVSPTMAVGPQSSDVTAAKNETTMFISFIYYGLAVIAGTVVLFAVIIFTIIVCIKKASFKPETQKDIAMKENSAYEKPPLRVKMTKNEAYATVHL